MPVHSTGDIYNIKFLLNKYPIIKIILNNFVTNSITKVKNYEHKYPYIA